jgi:hypothetical protein
LIQERGTINSEQLIMNNERKLYENCRVQGFELRILRGEAIKLKLDITSKRPPVLINSEQGIINNGNDEGRRFERFMGDRVIYRINSTEYTNIYGMTLSTKKEGGTKTELWIKRALAQGPDIPGIIDELTITAQLLRDKYEYRYYGMFRITLKGLVLVSDETAVDCADGLIGPLRYYVTGTVNAEVFSNNEELIMNRE